MRVSGNARPDKVEARQVRLALNNDLIGEYFVRLIGVLLLHSKYEVRRKFRPAYRRSISVERCISKFQNDECRFEGRVMFRCCHIYADIVCIPAATVVAARRHQKVSCALKSPPIALSLKYDVN